jgi:hypothetical protein
MFNSLLRILIHYFHIFNSCYIFFNTLFPHFYYDISIFLILPYLSYIIKFFPYFITYYVFLIHFSIFLIHFSVFLIHFFVFLIHFSVILIHYLSINQSHVACDVRAWMKSGAWSPLGKYVLSMQNSIKHRVSMYVVYN